MINMTKYARLEAVRQNFGVSDYCSNARTVRRRRLNSMNMAQDEFVEEDEHQEENPTMQEWHENLFHKVNINIIYTNMHEQRVWITEDSPKAFKVQIVSLK